MENYFILPSTKITNCT